MNNCLLRISILIFLTLSFFIPHAQAAENGTITITVTIAEAEIIPATVDFRPETIRPGLRFIRCYIELPNPFRVEDIDTATVALTEVNGSLIEPPLKTSGQARIGDYDRDGIADLEVRFDVRRIIPLLQPGKNSLTVSGNMRDGRKFAGTEIVSMIKRR